MILSVDGYEHSERRDRQAFGDEDLSDSEIEAIRQAEPPAEVARYDHELTAGHGEGS